MADDKLKGKDAKMDEKLAPTVVKLTDAYSVCHDGTNLRVGRIGASDKIMKVNPATGATLGDYSVGNHPAYFCHTRSVL